MFLEERRYPPRADSPRRRTPSPEIYDEDFESSGSAKGARAGHVVRAVRRSCSSGSCRTRSGSSAASSTSPTTASTGTSRRGTASEVAYHWEGEPEGERREVTYADLQREVTRLANALKELGVGKGTPVGIYMGMVPEAARSRCSPARGSARRTRSSSAASRPTRSPTALHDMECEVLITQDEAWRRGTTVPLKRTADEALGGGAGRRARPSSSAARATRCRCRRAATTGGTSSTHRRPASCPPEPMDAEDLLYLLYTSGTTAKPKGIVHTTGRLPRRRRRDAPLRLRPQAGRRTSTGARPTSAGSPATATSSTGRSATARRASSTRARPTSRTRTAGGRSSSATASRSSTRRRPRSAPT